MRKIINNQLEELNNKEVALLFSGGMDSLSLLISCLDVGIKPHLYTFKLNYVESEDVLCARKIKDIFNLNYTEIKIDDSIEQLVDDVYHIIKKFKVKKKTQIQCIQPFLHILPNIKESVVLSGLCADDIYGTSRKMQELGRKDEDEFFKKRLEKHNNIESSSYKFIKEICEDYNKQFIAPYKDNEILVRYILNCGFKKLHSPKQKNIMYEAYKEEIDSYKLYRRNSNLQVNSGIRGWHDTLLNTGLNSKNYKSVVGIYNTIYRYYWGDR